MKDSHLLGHERLDRVRPGGGRGRGKSTLTMDDIIIHSTKAQVYTCTTKRAESAKLTLCCKHWRSKVNGRRSFTHNKGKLKCSFISGMTLYSNCKVRIKLVCISPSRLAFLHSYPPRKAWSKNNEEINVHIHYNTQHTIHIQN